MRIAILALLAVAACSGAPRIEPMQDDDVHEATERPDVVINDGSGLFYDEPFVFENDGTGLFWDNTVTVIENDGTGLFY
jgi:hypothetical protein